MRRLRAGFVTPLPGGLGAPPYGHYDPCARSSLNGLSLGSGTQARPGACHVRLSGSVAEPRWSAERRAGSVIARVAPRKRDSWCASRRSAPLTLVRERKGMTAYPAPQTIRAAAPAKIIR